MKVINFTLGSDKSPYCYLYTVKRTVTGLIITDIYHDHEWSEGDIINPERSKLIPEPTKRHDWKVVKVIQQRDAISRFNIPEHAKNSFFELELIPAP